MRGSLPLLERHTTHLDEPRGAGGTSGAQLSVDWRFARGTAVGIDSAHSRPSPMPSVALLGGGAILGKVAAANAGKAAATAATKAMAGKLAAPFVAKVGATLAPAAASVGAAAGGPVGVVVGTGIGLAADYALAKGLELAGRPELRKGRRVRAAYGAGGVALRNGDGVAASHRGAPRRRCAAHGGRISERGGGAAA